MGLHSLKLLHSPQSSKEKYKLPTMDKMQTSMTSYTASSLEILPCVHHAIFNLQSWAYVFSYLFILIPSTNQIQLAQYDQFVTFPKRLWFPLIGYNALYNAPKVTVCTYP